MAKWLAVLALAAAPPQEKEWKGKPLPELVSEKGHWINAAEALKLEKLRGKVVWVEIGSLN